MGLILKSTGTGLLCTAATVRDDIDFADGRKSSQKSLAFAALLCDQGHRSGLSISARAEDRRSHRRSAK
jgi:hypothetical protein